MFLEGATIFYASSIVDDGVFSGAESSGSEAGTSPPVLAFSSAGADSFS